MVYNEFGRSGPKVSRFGMGCMRLPSKKDEHGNETIDEAESIKMIRHAIDRGVNYFDTAYAYSGSEALLGKALRDGYRDRVMIATKTPVGEIKEYGDYQRIFDEQLERLQTDHIDFYLFHCLDRKNWEKLKSTGGIAFTEELKKSGRIGNIGFSFHAEHDLFKEILDAYNWDMCLIQLNILDRNHQAGVKGLQYAGQKGVPVVIMEPLKGGLLGNKPPEEVDDLLKDCHESRSLVEWSFRWLYNQSEVKVVISGVSSMEQLKENIRIVNESDVNILTPSDEDLILRIKDIYDAKVKVGCTGCGYCMPCPAGVNIPEIFKIYNDSGLSPWTEFGKVFYSLVVDSNGRGVSNCVECRNCEEHCPQKLLIVSLLKEAHEVMKS